MEVFEEKQQLCQCYKECQNFQKYVELKDSGLVVYRHTPQTEDTIQAEAVESDVNTTGDASILNNKKNVEITSSELEQEKENISCPRCRKKFENAQEFLQEVKSIDRKMVMGICDHCRKKAQTSKNLFCSCDKIVKKFISVKGEQKEDTKIVLKTLPLKMGNLRNDKMVNKQNQNTYSDFQINRGLYPPASKHEPEIQQMFSHIHFNSDATDLSETNLKEGHVKQTVALLQPIEPVKTSSAHIPQESENINTIIPGTLLVDSETTFVETSVGLKELPRQSLNDRKQEEIFKDKPSMDAKEALKIRHDVSLRQMMRLEKDFKVPSSVSKRSYLSESTKVAPWAQKEPTSKYDVESEMDIKIPTLKNNRGPRGTRDLDYLSNTEVKYRSTKASQYSYYEPRKANKYHHDKMKHRLFDSEEGTKKQKKLGNRYIAVEELKLQRSVDKISHKAKKPVQHVTKSKTGPIETVGNIFQRQYSFFFPTVKEKEEKKVKVDVSSSHLIKDIQEKLHLKAEREKKKEEEERQRKHEPAQKEKLTREGKILQPEEKKRQAVGDTTKYEKEQRKLDEEQEKYDEQQIKLAEHKKYSKKNLESKLVVKEKKQDKPRRDKSKENDGEIISEPNLKSKIPKVSMVVKKQVMPKPDHRDKTSGVSEEKKMGGNVKPSDDETTENDSKDLKSKTKQKDKMNEVSEKAKTDLKVKLEQEDKDKRFTLKGKISKVSMVGKQHVMLKPDKTDGVSEKNKMNVTVKSGNDEATEKGSIDLMSGTEQKGNMNEVSEKAKIDLKAKLKDVAKKQKIKPENKDQYETKLKKQVALPQERETRKAPAIKDKEQIDARSKKGIASKLTRDASDEIKVYLPKIEKSLKKATSDNQITPKVKQGKGKESESKILKKVSSIPVIASELQKNQVQRLKEKQEVLKKKNQLENEAKVPKAKEEPVHKANGDKFERRRNQKEKGRSEAKLKLVKQATKMGPSNILPEVLKIHKCNHQHSGKKSPFCQLCLNSELEMEVISLNGKKNVTTEQTDIIIGEKIFKYKPRLEKMKEPEGVPILFQKEFCVESDKQLKQIEQIIPQATDRKQKQIRLTKIETEPDKPGVIRYALSDRTFIDKGWTMLPTEKVMRKMNVYRMRPAHPEFDWFEHNKNKRLMTYDTGERLAEFDDNGRGRWYYRNGRLALDYYNAEETNAQQRIVIYSSGEPDERGRTYPITILAIFDYLGNGIVFDHAGKIRLKYNQTEGVVLDRKIGPVSHWQWHSLNDPPVLQQIITDTQMAIKDPNILKFEPEADTTRPDNKEMLAIEFDNFIKEKSKKLSQKYKPFQIRMKALKINERFSLKILDQATVYLIFRDGSTNLKLNIGMILDHQEIVDVDTAEMGKVSNSLERLPARTDSLAGLQRSVGRAQYYERQHTERERRLRPPEPCASADHLIAAVSPPMRLPLRTVPTGSSSSTGYRCSRKSTDNLYYDTSLRC